jgi:hypothetical protein
MVHTLTHTAQASAANGYMDTLSCSCGWSYTDPTFPWLVSYARQHAARGNAEWA